MARVIGLRTPVASDELHDLAVVGAGPAGLAASVYGASEALSTIVLDCGPVDPAGSIAIGVNGAQKLGSPDMTWSAVLRPTAEKAVPQKKP